MWFRLDYLMQLKYSYYIATNVCSRKSAITFGDLPDCWVLTCLCANWKIIVVFPQSHSMTQDIAIVTRAYQTWYLIDIDFIHGDIHYRSCENTIHLFYRN